jgi:hypothetical protein
MRLKYAVPFLLSLFIIYASAEETDTEVAGRGNIHNEQLVAEARTNALVGRRLGMKHYYRDLVRQFRRNNQTILEGLHQYRANQRTTV